VFTPIFAHGTVTGSNPVAGTNFYGENEQNSNSRTDSGRIPAQTHEVPQGHPVLNIDQQVATCFPMQRLDQRKWGVCDARRINKGKSK
jgi:hypothetical protein